MKILKSIATIFSLSLLAFFLGGIFTAAVFAAPSLAQKLAGRFLLAVEDKGKIWYVDPMSLKRELIDGPKGCWDLAKKKKMGISNKNLNQIATATDKQAPGKNYYNNEYKFRLTFPSSWSTVLTDSCGKDCVEFFLPTASTKWPSNKASKFVISIFNEKIWEDYLKEEGPKDAYIAKRRTEIFAYSIGQDEPEDQIGKLREVKNIIATFQFLD